MTRVAIELAERFSIQHDSEELRERLLRANAVELDTGSRAYRVLRRAGLSHEIAVHVVDERLQELAEGTDYDLEAGSR